LDDLWSFVPGLRLTVLRSSHDARMLR